MLEEQILCYPGIPVLTSEEVFNFVIVIFNEDSSFNQKCDL